MTTPVLLTIAGTDPSGGAGLQVSAFLKHSGQKSQLAQADLKVFTTHECYGMSVCTALVAQNTTGVQDIVPTSAEFVTKQVGRSSLWLRMMHPKIETIGLNHSLSLCLETFLQRLSRLGCSQTPES
jgi:hydroxymethylpyrimidine/phosphomethylpyrimidine kinase